MSRVPLRAVIALLGALLFLAAIPARAQEQEIYLPNRPIGPLRQAIYAEATANAEDVLIGGSLAALVAARPGLSVGASFAMRPYRRWVREPVGPHLLLQLHERRYAFALEVSDQYPVHPNLALYSKIGLGYVFADYEGTRRDPDEGWYVSADAGFALTMVTGDRHIWSLRIAHRYADLRSDNRGWMHVAVGMTF